VGKFQQGASLTV